MCGVAGIFSPQGGVREELVASMAGKLAHRGPDDFGTWASFDTCVGLGHTRLSILDLSPLGHQPMLSACGRYAIAFNGEIYNHLQLREELPGCSFRSTSDTETILAAVSAWGFEKALQRFVGMFGIALWDGQDKRLFLAVDRLGIKPMYYARLSGQWLFGSELKALKAHHEYGPSIDRDVLGLYFRHNYIPAPHCIYHNTWKLEPGQMAVLDKDGLSLSKWWDVKAIWESGVENPFGGSDAEAVDKLEALLRDAVSLRMISDVPLGAFLSGGIDSSTVVALMQELSQTPVRTFSIGFHETAYNEAGYAAGVAKHLGTDHTELFVTPDDLLSIVPSIPVMWDEPFADSSQIPTAILCKMTRGYVTVALSGDGGDELFSGYERYFWTANIWKHLNKVPGPVRGLASVVGRRLPDKAFDLLGSRGQKFRWRLDALGVRDFEELYRYFTSHFKQPEAFVLGCQEPETPMSVTRVLNGAHREWMSLFDLLGYLPGDILTKVDRASMGVALEARVPILDHRVVEFAARVPMSMKVRNGSTKWLLRQVLDRHVPHELTDRPKMGFGVPIEQWMRNELREWCDDLLSPSVIRSQGYLDADLVERMWREYLAGETNWNYYLWDILMFQAWLENWE